MYLLPLCVLFITVSVSHQQIYCVNKCSCDGIDSGLDLEVVMGVTDCCESNSTSVKGNVDFTNNTVTNCVLCSALCGTGGGTCVINPITVSCLIYNAVNFPYNETLRSSTCFSQSFVILQVMCLMMLYGDHKLINYLDLLEFTAFSRNYLSLSS